MNQQDKDGSPGNAWNAAGLVCWPTADGQASHLLPTNLPFCIEKTYQLSNYGFLDDMFFAGHKSDSLHLVSVRSSTPPVCHDIRPISTVATQELQHTVHQQHYHTNKAFAISRMCSGQVINWTILWWVQGYDA